MVNLALAATVVLAGQMPEPVQPTQFALPFAATAAEAAAPIVQQQLAQQLAQQALLAQQLAAQFRQQYQQHVPVLQQQLQAQIAELRQWQAQMRPMYVLVQQDVKQLDVSAKQTVDEIRSLLRPEVKRWQQELQRQPSLRF